MSSDTPAFFTLDRGTVSINATLVAPVDGRYRMLAAATAPVGIDPESVLEDLAWRVARTDASVTDPLEGWRDWSRLEVVSGRVARGVLVAASEAAGELAERAFVAAGWDVGARFYGPEPDLVAFGEACLEPAVDAVVMSARANAEEAERDTAHRLWARCGALARFRDDLAVIACGPLAERPEGVPEQRLYSLPAPEPVASTAESMLRLAAGQVGVHLVNRGEPMPPDSRVALRNSIASLAAVLATRIDGIEVGAVAGSRTIAGPEGESGHAVLAAAGLLPPALLDDDEAAEAVLRWSTLPGDPAGRLDALRELVLHPWSGVDEDGTHLRLAALRAALERLDTTWSAGRDGDTGAAELLVLGGGAFAPLPAAASALAVVDAIRRPGAVSILHDHANLLAPLGALPVEDDRRRLLLDLMPDCLLPLGSALLTGAIAGSAAGTGGTAMHVASALGEEDLRLEPGVLRLVDLPPGISARLDIDPGDRPVLGVAGRRLSIEVRGGLAGLLVDTRAIPLDLAPTGEARRTALSAWEEPIWMGSER